MKPVEPPMPDLSTPIHHKNPNSPLEVSIKIFLAISGLILVVLGAIYAYTLLMENQIRPSEYESFKYLPTAKTPTKTLVTPTLSYTDMANWKTYRNKTFGYEITYLPDWHIAGPYGGQAGYECLENPENVTIVEFSKVKLTNCGFAGEQLPPQEADITIWVSEQSYSDLNVLGTPDAQITISGEKAVKYIFTDKSELPNIQASRLYFNHGGKGYLVFLKQTDRKGSYDLVYDQILSTFKFLDQSPSPTCRPRPACLDSKPRCLIPETPDMCPPKVVCTQEAKLCPDGSYVSRQGPNCEFAACPNL